MAEIEVIQSDLKSLPAIASAQEFRLESAGAINEWNRWSYVADAPLMQIRCDADRVTTLSNAGGVVQKWHDPLEAIQWMGRFHRISPTSGPPFKGGWIGWISYEFGRVFEKLPGRAQDDLGLPLFEFTYHDRVWAMDRAENVVYRVTLPRSEDLPPIQFEDSIGLGNENLSCNFTRAEYERAVRRAIEYIGAGDVFQVNLSQRFSAGLREAPWKIYARLQREAGAMFGGYLGYGDHALICNSPELFLRVVTDPPSRKRRVVTRPIKGTRPRGVGMEEALRRSEKDQAELNMIVDLERNDLGRVCEIGSVRVTTPREIEAHPTVYHGVATIEGMLRDEVTLVDLLRATFPSGSVTGAPKIRAMEIIDELEPTCREPYCGAIGFIGNDGHIEFNVAIRTMIAAKGRIYIPVGGGIVADSEPAAEYEETLVKARAMMGAVGIVIS
ncbi:MAG TPA: anthranilate synthase component I family protein [Tepidisphaeraceae bacterium]|nr:anthranilate synthase component I family protein [Tepidisphaeraceae bacterium]